ncbi:hypothetical protein [Marinifilum caeruleilacunae]|uniref:Uncharacterized protein n=1 Tax=Marinifilum caeruleilacunae TaxID=2499076 RepID=A0ABX1WU83_9BACT|nr:hypothetical protein [Marinifilum caeruleilacunae]NOU59666.1 hypothetical protein [Marinifilum caeruleilacunae]
MNQKKVLYNLLFVVITAIALTVLIEFELTDKYMGFALIPMLIAYYLGQWAERKTRPKSK